MYLFHSDDNKQELDWRSSLKENLQVLVGTQDIQIKEVNYSSKIDRFDMCSRFMSTNTLLKVEHHTKYKHIIIIINVYTLKRYVVALLLYN